MYHKKLFFYDVLCDGVDDDDDGEFIGIKWECENIVFLRLTTAAPSISVLIVCNI